MSDAKQKHPPEGVHVTYQHQYRTCGKSSCHCCSDPERRHGPYWYAYWRDEVSKLHSSYIGKTSPFAEVLPSTESKVEADDLDLELALL